MESVWTETIHMPHFYALEGDIKTDVLIIGGGITGILCAYMLEHVGIDYVLVEAERICSGITKNTTAKITAQHGMIYHKLLKKYGVEKAGLYLEANENALKKYYQLSRRIDCDFEMKDSFVYSLNDRSLCEEELEALEKIGISGNGYDFVPQIPLPFETAGAVRFAKQAQFHPLKFLAGIVPGMHIYENTFVKQIQGKAAITDKGQILADKIIIATHFPFINRHGSYFLKMYQHRSYVIAYENGMEINGMYVDEAEKGRSFRNYKDLLLVGGGSHRTGKRGGNWEEIESFVSLNNLDMTEQYRWATQDCMTLDGIPYIGQYSASTPDLYVATGFQKWGMTSAMAAAEILRDLILEKENPYAKVFSPSRNMIHPQLAVNVFESITNLLTFTGKRCPHMGCSLKWNAQEHSWDCPCHGSRFASDGALVDNPAKRDLKS